jgi:hypothetical protein
MAESPTLGDLLAETIAAARGSINTALPATVLDYDPATQAITAKPTISGRYQDPDTDALIPVPLPAIANVPVAFPSAAGFAITWPLSPGDTVLLVFADRSMDEWKATGAQETIPADVRRFDLTDAIAITGLRPSTRPIPASGFAPSAMVLEGLDIRLGSSAATDFVALASKVMGELVKLKSALEAHVHAGVTPGNGVSATAAPIPSVVPVPLAPVGALKVKAE